MLKIHMDKYSLNYNKIIGIKPTGWTTPRSTGGSKHYSIESKSSNITVYGLFCLFFNNHLLLIIQFFKGFPYSEHSSFDELKDFIQYLKPKRIIPTYVNKIHFIFLFYFFLFYRVNVGRANVREKMNGYFRQWLSV